MNIFQAEALKIPNGWRCLRNAIEVAGNYQFGDCYFGIPQSSSFIYRALEVIPEKARSFYFYLGGDCEDLIEAFTRSHYPQLVQRLSVGDSSFSFGKSLNYTKITKILSESYFPNLETFELGIWELFCNANCLFGNIGDVTKLLSKMPNLENLSLYGSFELQSPLTFPKLRSLSLQLSDYETGVRGEFIPQSTLDNLLESSFPLLEKASIDLDYDDEVPDYTISDVFASGVNVPRLNSVEFVGGYREGEAEKLKQSPFSSCFLSLD